ncbi:MAG: hypothetical protein AAF645_30530 [Myxococcota bacterium]
MMGSLCLALVGWLVYSVIAKKKRVQAAQDNVWQATVARLSGQKLDNTGPLGSARYRVGDAMLVATNVVGTDANIAQHITPIDRSNDWKTHVAVSVKRPVPPFELLPGQHRGGVPTGDPAFDAAWTLISFDAGQTPALLALFDAELVGALKHLATGGPYHICSGGSNITATRSGAEESGEHLSSLIFACRRLAGDA